MSRLWEFFEDDKGKLSSRAALMYISVGSFCILLFVQSFSKNPSQPMIDSLIIAIVTLVGGVVSVNKVADAFPATTAAKAAAAPAIVTNAEKVEVNNG